MDISFINGTSAISEIIGTGTKMTEDEANEKLSTYSNINTFYDDTWDINKSFVDKNSERCKHVLYFSKIENIALQTEVKFWILYRLMKRRSISTLNDDIIHISKFAKLLDKSINSFNDVSANDVLSFYSLLFEAKSNVSLRTQLRAWTVTQLFAKEMKYNNLSKYMNKYIVEKYQTDYNNPTIYISDESVAKLDIFMKKEDVPLAFKTIYWSLRLIPNRITEVLSMTTKCLKKIDDNSYVITIPTFKQAGSYYKGSVKMIEIKYDGIGKYYIDLLKEQIKFTNDNIVDDKNDFLFYSNIYATRQKNSEIYFTKNKRIFLISYIDIRRFLKKICELKNITDDDGSQALLGTHQFRHNAITDRIVSGIFRPIDVMGLTAHHNTQMIESTYTHRKPEDLVLEKKPVVFNGRIINTDNDVYINQLLKRPYSKRIYKLGICSDTRSCGKDKTQCLRCKYLVPNIDDLDYYKNEIADWKNKKEKADVIGNKDFSELCDYWVESYNILIQRILTAISDEKIEIEKEQE